MADYTTLIDQIKESIKPNGNGSITGQVLQDTLINIVDGGLKKSTYSNIGSIGTNGKPVSNSWVHSNFIPSDALVKCGNFITNASVLNVAYYREDNFDSFISGQSLLAGEKTKDDLIYPEGTNFIVISTDPSKAELYAYTTFTGEVEQLDKNVKKISEDINSLENQTSIGKKGFLHLSFDDTIYTLKDIIDKSYSSIFEQPFFALLKNLHDRFGAVFSCYCFLDYKVDEEIIFSLEDFTEPRSGELKENSSWLKFGLHSKDYNTNYNEGTEETAKADYNRFISQIVRITGTVESIDMCPRLQSFTGNLITCQTMRDAKCGIIGLLTSDYSETGSESNTDISQGYYLTDPATKFVARKGKWFDVDNQLWFFPSNLRLDNIMSFNVTDYMNKFLTIEKYGRASILIMYAHENQVFIDNSIRSDYVKRLEYCCQWAIDNGYNFDFPMNTIRKTNC